MLRYLKQYRRRFDAPHFEDNLPTIRFMEMVLKLFRNIYSRTSYMFCRNPNRMPFSFADDDR